MAEPWLISRARARARRWKVIAVIPQGIPGSERRTMANTALSTTFEVGYRYRCTYHRAPGRDRLIQRPGAGQRRGDLAPQATVPPVPTRVGRLSPSSPRCLDRRDRLHDRRQPPGRGDGRAHHRRDAAGHRGGTMPELSCPRAPTVALQEQEADCASAVAATPAVGPSAPPQPERQPESRAHVHGG